MIVLKHPKVLVPKFEEKIASVYIILLDTEIWFLGT